MNPEQEMNDFNLTLSGLNRAQIKIGNVLILFCLRLHKV